MQDGKIVKTGTAELAKELEQKTVIAKKRRLIFFKSFYVKKYLF